MTSSSETLEEVFHLLNCLYFHIGSLLDVCSGFQKSWKYVCISNKKVDETKSFELKTPSIKILSSILKFVQFYQSSKRFERKPESSNNILSC
jgi:hypothetical protein